MIVDNLDTNIRGILLIIQVLQVHHIFCLFEVKSSGSYTLSKAIKTCFQDFKSIKLTIICTLSSSPYLKAWGQSSIILSTTTPSYYGFNTLTRYTNFNFSSYLIYSVYVLVVALPDADGRGIIGK
jgi:hypothetical protein